jgi:dephospho-CoA kinase
MSGPRPLTIGLTGGIASGKSMVAARFAALGVPVMDADAVSRELLAPGTPLQARVIERFGPRVLQRYGQPLQRPDGTLDRRLLRRLVFEDAAERRALEALTHPAIRARSDALPAPAAGPNHINVNPRLAERQARSRYDRVLVVDCPEPLQRERLAARDGSCAAEIDAMLTAQASRPARLAVADDIIVNDADPQALDVQVAALDRHYRALASASGH